MPPLKFVTSKGAVYVPGLKVLATAFRVAENWLVLPAPSVPLVGDTSSQAVVLASAQLTEDTAELLRVNVPETGSAALYAGVISGTAVLSPD